MLGTKGLNILVSIEYVKGSLINPLYSYMLGTKGLNWLVSIRG